MEEAFSYSLHWDPLCITQSAATASLTRDGHLCRKVQKQRRSAMVLRGGSAGTQSVGLSVATAETTGSNMGRLGTSAG